MKREANEIEQEAITALTRALECVRGRRPQAARCSALVAIECCDILLERRRAKERTKATP